MAPVWSLMNNAITPDDKLELVKFILSTDFYTNGPKVKEFEKAWSEWLGCKHSLFVSSGSTANTLLVAAVKELYNIPNGSKVLVPACTWVTNVGPIIQLGLEPVFCDISLDHFSFDESKLPDDPDSEIRLVFVTHLLGINAPIEKFKEKYPNALFIEDICESHGVLDDSGKKRGSDSSLGSTFSFYYGHHMTTIEGGMVSTNNSELYELMLIKRSHGMARNHSPEYFQAAIEKYPDLNPQFMFLTDGYNFRNTELAAVLGICQLKRLDENIAIRRRNYKKFIELLEEFQGDFYVPNKSETNSSFCLPLILKDSTKLKELKRILTENSIENRPVVAGNLLLHPFLKEWSRAVDNTPNANILNFNGVYIGNSQFVNESMIDDLRQALCKNGLVSPASQQS